MSEQNNTPLEVKQPDPRAKLKEGILKFYADAPIKQWAADSVGISVDTLRNWEKEDSAFSADLIRLKAEYGKRRLARSKNNEWVLERMFRQEFEPPQHKTDITSGGKPIPLLAHVSSNISNKEDNKSE